MVLWSKHTYKTWALAFGIIWQLRTWLVSYNNKFFTLKICCSRKKKVSRRLILFTHFPKESQHAKHGFFHHWAEPVHYVSEGFGLHLQTLKLQFNTWICRAAGHFCRSVDGSAGVWQWDSSARSQSVTGNGQDSIVELDSDFQHLM